MPAFLSDREFDTFHVECSFTFCMFAQFGQVVLVSSHSTRVSGVVSSVLSMSSNASGILSESACFTWLPWVWRSSRYESVWLARPDAGFDGWI